jgi:hypothetical protein
MNRKKLAEASSVALLTAISAWFFTLSNTFRDSISGDFPEYIRIAKNLSLNPETFNPVGTWPLGYPLLLRMASFNGSWQHAGSLISFIFSATIGISAFYLLRTCFDNISSLFGAIASMMTRPVLVNSVGYSSDVPAMAFAFVSLANFALWSKKKSQGYLFMAGVFAGLSYLIRYSSITVGLLLLAMILLYPLFDKQPFKIATIVVHSFIFLGGWILAASPQLIGSWITHGNPLYTENGCNVALAMGLNMKIGGLTWTNVKDVFPYCRSLTAVIAHDPREFVYNFRANLFTSAQLMNLQIVASLFCMISLCFFSKKCDERWHRNFVVATISAVAISNILVVSLAFVTERHLILSISLLNCISCAVIVSSIKEKSQKSWIALFFLIPIVLESLFTAQLSPLFRRLSPRTEKTLQTYEILKSLGCKYFFKDDIITKFDTVLIGDDFILPDKYIKIGNQPWRRNYKSFLTIESTKAWMLKNGYKCLIFDEDSLLKRIPSIDGDSFRQEYKQGKLFAKKAKASSHQTLVFSMK